MRAGIATQIVATEIRQRDERFQGEGGNTKSKPTCCKTNYETRLKFTLASASMVLTLLAVVEQHGLKVMDRASDRHADGNNLQTTEYWTVS